MTADPLPVVLKSEMIRREKGKFNVLSDGGYKDNHGNPDYETVEFDDESQIHLGGLEYEGESKDIYHFCYYT